MLARPIGCTWCSASSTVNPTIALPTSSCCLGQCCGNFAMPPHLRHPSLTAAVPDLARHNTAELLVEYVREMYEHARCILGIVTRRFQFHSHGHGHGKHPKHRIQWLAVSLTSYWLLVKARLSLRARFCGLHASPSPQGELGAVCLATL